MSLTDLYNEVVYGNVKYVALEDLEREKHYDKVYRILDTKYNTWHRSNSRDVWIRIGDCKRTLNHANKNLSPDWQDRYQIKIFNLVPEE